jgi:DHA1 family multidrug resistance protein-like MFS transporter
LAERWVGVSSGEKMSVRAMLVLTLPTFAFSAASTLVPFFVPQFLRDYTSSNTLVGFIVGGEGIFCLLIPLWVGVQSDRIWTKRWGRRRPFMIYAAPFMAASLILIPFQPGLVPIAVSTFIFFAAYHFYSSPYQSLLPDVTPPGFHGRVQGYQAVMRGGGMFLGMIAAMFLFGLWKPLPFIICGVLIMVVTYVTVVKVDEPQYVASEHQEQATLWGEMARLWRLTWKNKPIRRFMVAAFLWEGTLAGLKPFIVSYFTDSLRASPYMSGVLFVIVGLVYLVAGLLSGYLADRFGRSMIMRIGLWLYLVGSAVALLMGNYRWAFVFLPIFGLGGAIVMTLPYAILMKMMPRGQVGGLTAMFSMVRGLANVVAPLIAGGAVDVARKYLAGTQYAGRQYSAIWGVCGLMIIISLFVFKGSDKEDVVGV